MPPQQTKPDQDITQEPSVKPAHPEQAQVELPTETESMPAGGEKVEEKIDKSQVTTTPTTPAPPPAPTTPPTQTPTPDPTHEAVEDILEKDLENIYFQMDDKHKKEFKKKGEQTTGLITTLVKTAHATVKKVLSLIRGWLKVIPGINKFFLEQEAKIKTDEIMQLEKEAEMKHEKNS